jgi:hypothetical protein
MGSRPLSRTAALARDAGVELNKYGFVESADASRFIYQCLAEEELILGVEGFRKQPDGYAPDMDWIGNWSGVADHVESAHLSHDFIQAAPNDLMFEFTVAT